MVPASMRPVPSGREISPLHFVTVEMTVGRDGSCANAAYAIEGVRFLHSGRNNGEASFSAICADALL